MLAAGLVAACAPTGTSSSDSGPSSSATTGSADTVQTLDDLGRSHLAQGATPPSYNSNPPTSGPHAPTVMAWGIHERLSPKEVLIHNMEHGGIVVWYNCQGGQRPLTSAQCDTLRRDLGRVVQVALDANKLVVMGPYPQMNRRIALTAWTKIDSFDEFDVRRVAHFIDTYERAFNPENF